MLTRSERKKLQQRGIDCEFFSLGLLPKRKVESNADESSKTARKLVEYLDEKTVQSGNVGSTGNTLDIEECIKTSECITMMESENNIGQMFVPDSTTADDTVQPNLNCTLMDTPQDDIHSKPCYCDFIILPSTEPEPRSESTTTLDDMLFSLGLVRNIKPNLKIDELEIEPEPSDKSGPHQHAIRSSSVLSLPTNYKCESNDENLVEPEIISSILDFETNLNETDHKIFFDEEFLNENNFSFEFSMSNLDQEPILEPSEINRIIPKVKVLDILHLPPGTIDPLCPIDIFHEPIDLSMKRIDQNDPAPEEPLDLTVRKQVPCNNQPSYNQSECAIIPSSQITYEDDEVLVLDTSYACFDTLSLSSVGSENSESLNRAECYIQPEPWCHNERKEFLEPDVPPPMYLSEFSTNLEIRRRVYEMLDYPCFRFFGNSSCKRIPCKFRHNLVEAEHLQEMLEYEPIIIIEKCYLLVQEFDSLFVKYFQIFCIIFGQKRMIKNLVRMVNHCEKPKRPVTFYRHIITGFRLCKLDEVECFANLIRNSTSKSPKSFNILIWIMFDLDVVLDFRDELRKILNYDGFYISAPNLTRLLGVCSRTKNCELIRIIYEAIENYPEKMKEQLHWSLRPQFIRMDK